MTPELVTHDPGLGIDLDRIPVLDDLQLGHLRHLENLANQLPGDWSKMGGADPGQELFDAYRYQLAYMAYTLGLAHYHWLPAAPSAVKPTFEKTVGKMLRRDVWGYWKEASGGARALDPDIEELREPWTDPVVKENIMYSGHLYAMTGLHATLFDDDRYDAPGALTFEWNPVFQGLAPEIHVYQRSTLGEAIYWQMVENGWLGVACEPNCIFIVCNQFPMMGFRFEDIRNGTARAEEATQAYAAAWERRGMYADNGSIYPFLMVKQNQLVPPVGVTNDAWVASVMNTWNRDVVRETFPQQLRGTLKTGPDGTISPYAPSVIPRVRAALAAGEPADLPQDTTDPTTDPTFGYVAAALSELGDERLRGLLAHADRFMNPTWENGGLYYPRDDRPWDAEGNRIHVDAMTGNVMLGYSRLNVPDGLWSLYNRPWTAEHFAQPHVAAQDGEVDLRRAYYHRDSHTLLLTARPRDSKPSDVSLTVANSPSRPWTLSFDGVTVAGSDGPEHTSAVRVVADGDTLRISTALDSETTLALRWS
ncbi:hypothetical protein PS467_08190 [Streptomyces luomodiensis]|uniref:Linalool dehydratase/isomerase domain-containing protein n=1 Tax=Streptomyces luomodiensis TaxID=3026192 RepID=A0ABY9UTM8_9ACTN|nr:hypothetical protein [Streptomyces sp. SCA4-21]WNE95332.1 hypothetical protein PS467_08190 [Streptomyces sp. SCA4-21]